MRLLFVLLATMAIAWAGSASAATYKMKTLEGNRGHFSIVYETVTTSDYLVAPAYSFQRLSFTQGSTLEFEVFACDTAEYDSSTCESLGAVSAGTNNLELKTGHQFLVIDITTAETAGYVSYITIQSNPQNAGAGGGSGGGVVGSGTLAEMNAYPNPQAGDLWQQTDDDGTGDCATTGGTDSALLCQYDAATTAWVPAGIAGGTDNLGNHIATTDLDLNGNALLGGLLGADLDADNYGINNLSWWGRYGETAVTTEAELEAAIAACGVGVGSGSVSTGCEIAFCGEIETDGITVGGTTLAEAKSGVHIIGCGASQDNTTPARLAGAKLTYSDATGGGAVLTINGCKHCSFSGFDVDGNNAGAGADATAGISILGTAWGTSFTEFKGVTIENVNGYAIEVDSSSTDKQTDSMRFSEVSMRNNVGCYRSQSTYALLNWFINSECSTSTGTTLFDVLEGMLVLDDFYVGNAVNSTTLFKLGDAAHNFYYNSGHIELGATTGNTVFYDGTGTSNITERMRKIGTVQITYSGASNVIFNVRRRGSWIVDGMTLFSTGSDVATTSTFANPPGSALNRLTLALGNNYQRSADSGQSIVPEVWYPSTIGSAVIVKEAPLAAANLPEDDGGGDDKCRLGHIGIDTDATGAAKWKLCTANDTWTALTEMAATWTGAHDFGGATLEVPNSTSLPGSCTVGQVFVDSDATSGQQFYACEGGSFVLQGDGGGGGGGTVDTTGTPANDQVAVWTDANTLEGDSALAFDTTTDTLHGPLVFTFGAGTGTLNALDAVDATTEDTIEGLIFDADSASIPGAWDWTDTGTFDFGGPVSATSFTSDPSTSPQVLLVDADNSGEAGITADDAAGPDVILSIQADIAGSLTTFIEVDGVSEQIETFKPVLVGTAGVLVTPDGDGAITLLGQGDGADEDLTINLDDTSNSVSISSSTGVTTLDAGSIGFLTSGTIRGNVDVVVTTSGTDSPSCDELRGSMHIADNATGTADVDYTLPEISTCGAGASACFYDNGGGTGGVIIDAAAGDEILLAGTGVGVADAIDSPGVAGDGSNGDFICLLAIDSTYWITLGASGTWVDGGAD